MYYLIYQDLVWSLDLYYLVCLEIFVVIITGIIVAASISNLWEIDGSVLIASRLLLAASKFNIFIARV